MPAGRPLKFKTPEELDQKIDDYMESRGWKTKKVYSHKQDREIEVDYFLPATITGLAAALDTNRQTLLNYEEKDEYFDTIKRAKTICEQHAEEGAMMGELNPAMCIFSLKNNYNWRDKNETDVTSGGNPITVVTSIPNGDKS